MTTETAWGHLPNAPHIDRILAHLKKYPQKWDAARDAAWDAAWDTARGAARGAAWGASALIAWDDAAVMLTYHPAAIDTMANLGHPGALLLQPAVIAMREEVTD